MLRTWLSRWGQRKTKSGLGKKREGQFRKVRLETLEDRLAPAGHCWLGDFSALWSDTRNWLNNPMIGCNGSPQGDPTPTILFGFPVPPTSLTSVNDLGVFPVAGLDFQTSGIVINSLPGMALRLQADTLAGPSIIFRVAGTNTVLSPIVLTGGGTHTASYPGNFQRVLNLSGPISADTTIDSIAKSGIGELGLYGDNSFQGGVTVLPSTPPPNPPPPSVLAFGHARALGLGTLTLAGGTLRPTIDMTVANPIRVTADSIITGFEDVTFTGAGTFVGGRTLTVNSYGITRFTGELTGDGVVNVDAERDPRITRGKVALLGNNSFNGGVVLTTGILAVGSNTALGTGQLFTVSGQLQSDNTGATVVLSTLFTITGDTTFGGINGFTLTGDGTIGTGATLTLGNTLGNIILSGQLSGDGAIVKTGAGSALLSGDNLYLGGVTIRQGTLSITTDNALGEGQLNLAGGRMSVEAAITIPNTFIVSGDSTLAGNSNAIFSGLATFTGDVTFTLTITNTAITTFTNVIGGVGAIRIDVGTGGIVNFFGVSTYSGGTILVTGTITVNSDRSLGVGTVTLNGGAVQANAAVTLPNTLLINGSPSLTGASNLTITGGVTLLAPTNVFTIRNNAVTTFTSVINGSGQIALNAPMGTLNLPAANTYTGGTTLAAGTLTGHNNLSFGTGAFNFNGGRFLPAAPLTLANQWNVNGTPTLDAAHHLTFTGFGNLISGNLTVANNGITTFTHSAFINISGDGAITKRDGGTLVLTSNSDYRGGVTLIGGLLRIGHPNALGTGLITITGGTLRADTAVTVVNSINVDGSAAVDGTTNLTFGGPGVLTLATGVTLTLGNAATTTLNQAISGAGSLTVTAGTVVLTANNTYTGITTVNGGTLLVNGVQPSSAVNVNSATLGGTGTTGPVTLQGGSLRPGVSPGLLRASGNVSFNSASSLVLELDGTQPATAFDQYSVTGTLDLNSDSGVGSQLDLRPGFVPEVGTTFTVLTATGGIRGTFRSQPEGSLVVVGDLTFQISYRGGPNGNDITLKRVLTNTTMSLVSTPQPSNPGRAITFTATVLAAGGATGQPTGTVTFFESQNTLGVVPVVDGRAQLAVSFFTVGEYAITATYSGDGNFTPAGPAQLTQTVVPDLARPVNQRYVAQLYRDLLGREADQAGLNGFTQLLDQNQISRVGVVQAIQGSREYSQRVVRDLYRSILAREVDPFGLSVWTDFLSKGGTADRLQVLLMDSEEFFQRRGGGTATGFLQAVYQQILGRTVDAVGQRLWGARIAANSPRGSIADEILSSEESNRRRIDGLFRLYLRRPADTNGLNTFLASMRQGATIDAVAAAILGSAEYYQRA